MAATTRQIVGANGQILTIAVLPNAVGTVGDAQVIGLAKGAKTLTTPATSTTPSQVLAANPSRLLAVLTNPVTNTQTIFIGPSNVTSSAYTAELDPGGSWIDGDSNDAWYAVSSSGTPTLAVTEI